MKHPGIKDEWVERVIANPFSRLKLKLNGRTRYYGFIDEEGKWLRVIVDNGRLFNRFFDRSKLREWGWP